MTISEQYLEAAKVEELVGQLHGQGYAVLDRPERKNSAYDIVASRGGRKIAIAVKARSALRADAERLNELRQQAQAQGYAEFRLVVVNPPRERTVEIDGLDNALRHYLSDNFPDELDSLSSQTSLDDISEIDISSLLVTPSQILVAGTGIIEVTLEYGGKSDGLSFETSFPFDFGVTLDRELNVIEADELAIDTSSFRE